MWRSARPASTPRRASRATKRSRRRSRSIINPSSNGITLQLVPKASVDRIPILSIGYGLSAAASGTDFPWVFNPPATQFGRAVDHPPVHRDARGRPGAAQGQDHRIHLPRRQLTAASRSRCSQEFAADYGFAVKTYPVAAQQAQNQTAQWLDVGRDRPDWMIMWGFGPMNAAAVMEAAAIHFPMDRFIGSWHAGAEDDVQPAGAGAKGYLALNFHGIGSDYPAIQDIVKHVVDTGNSQAAREKVGENLYDRGVYNAVLIAQAIRNAQTLSGRKAVTGKEVRRGLEFLAISPGAVAPTRPAGLRRRHHRHLLHRPQRPPGGLCPAMGRHQMVAGVGLDFADDGAAASAAAGRRQGLRVPGSDLAEAHGAVRQVVVTGRGWAEQGYAAPRLGWTGRPPFATAPRLRSIGSAQSILRRGFAGDHGRQDFLERRRSCRTQGRSGRIAQLVEQLDS